MQGAPDTQNARLRGSIVAGAALLLAACASQSYMGISLVSGQAASEVQELARRAQNGDKQAQLDLGVRFEDGNGVVRNLARARQLYESAARPIKNITLIYIPSVRNSDLVAVLPVGSQIRQPGLAAAAERLAKIQNGSAGEH